MVTGQLACGSRPWLYFANPWNLFDFLIVTVCLLPLDLRFTTVLRPGGLLAVGHAESFPAMHPAFRACGRTAYDYLPR